MYIVNNQKSEINLIKENNDIKEDDEINLDKKDFNSQTNSVSKVLTLEEFEISNDKIKKEINSNKTNINLEQQVKIDKKKAALSKALRENIKRRMLAAKNKNT